MNGSARLPSRLQRYCKEAFIMLLPKQVGHLIIIDNANAADAAYIHPRKTMRCQPRRYGLVFRAGLGSRHSRRHIEIEPAAQYPVRQPIWKTFADCNF